MTELEQFLEQHWRLAMWVARRRVQHARGGLDPADAESDALLGLWNAARTYDAARGSASTWVRLTVDRAITDGIRARLHRRPAARTVNIDDVPDAFLPATPSPASAVAVRVDLRRAARGLKERERYVLARWLEGDHLAAIGADLGVTESAASLLLQAARGRLQPPAVQPGRQARRRPRDRSRATFTAHCSWCDTAFAGKRDARYCSNAHRQAAHRARTALANDHGPHSRLARGGGHRCVSGWSTAARSDREERVAQSRRARRCRCRKGAGAGLGAPAST